MEPTQETHISDFFGRSLYLKSSFGGRVWVVLHTLTFHKLETKAFESALKTYQIGNRIFAEHLEIYQDTLKQGESHLLLEERDYFAARSYLSQSTDQTHPHLATYRQLIAIEDTLQMPFPWKSFTLLAKEEPLSTSRKNKLTTWIHSLANHLPDLTSGKLHRCLSAYIDLLSQTDPNVSLAKLERGLLTYGLARLSEEDPEQIAWRELAEVGETLLCGEQEYTLAGRVADRYISDETVTFEVEGCPNYLVAIERNPALLGISKLEKEAKEWGLYSPRFGAADLSGKCALVERFTTSISERTWTSTSTLNQEDEAFLTPIANFIGWCVQRNLIPKTLDTHHYMYDRHGILRMTQVVEPTRLDGTQPIYQFFSRVAQGNSIIHDALVEKSGLPR